MPISPDQLSPDKRELYDAYLKAFGPESPLVKQLLEEEPAVEPKPVELPPQAAIPAPALIPPAERIRAGTTAYKKQVKKEAAEGIETGLGPIEDVRAAEERAGIKVGEIEDVPRTPTGRKAPGAEVRPLEAMSPWEATRAALRQQVIVTPEQAAERRTIEQETAQARSEIRGQVRGAAIKELGSAEKTPELEALVQKKTQEHLNDVERYIIEQTQGVLQAQGLLLSPEDEGYAEQRKDIVSQASGAFQQYKQTIFPGYEEREVEEAEPVGKGIPFLIEKGKPSVAGERIIEATQAALMKETPEGEIVETPAMQGMRVLGGAIRGVTEGGMQAISFDVDSEGNPLDPEDINYKIWKAQEEALEAIKAGDDTALDRAVTAASVLVPSGVVRAPTEGPRAQPSTGNFFRDVAIGVARGRSLGDDFMDMPMTRRFYEEVGAPDWTPFALGLATEVALPITPLPIGADIVKVTGRGGEAIGDAFTALGKATKIDKAVKTGEAIAGASRWAQEPLTLARAALRTRAAKAIVREVEGVADAGKIMDGVDDARVPTVISGRIGEEIASDIVGGVGKLVEAARAGKVSKNVARVIDESTQVYKAIQAGLEPDTAIAKAVAREAFIAFQKNGGAALSDTGARIVNDIMAAVKAGDAEHTDVLFAKLYNEIKDSPAIIEDVVGQIAAKRIYENVLNKSPNDLMFVTPTVVVTEKAWKEVGPKVSKYLQETMDVTVDTANNIYRFKNNQKVAQELLEAWGPQHISVNKQARDIYNMVQNGRPLTEQQYRTAIEAVAGSVVLREVRGSAKLKYTGPAAERAAVPAPRRFETLRGGQDVLNFIRTMPEDIDLFQVIPVNPKAFGGRKGVTPIELLTAMTTAGTVPAIAAAYKFRKPILNWLRAKGIVPIADRIGTEAGTEVTDEITRAANAAIRDAIERGAGQEAAVRVPMAPATKEMKATVRAGYRKKAGAVRAKAERDIKQITSTLEADVVHKPRQLQAMLDKETEALEFLLEDAERMIRAKPKGRVEQKLNQVIALIDQSRAKRFNLLRQIDELQLENEAKIAKAEAEIERISEAANKQIAQLRKDSVRRLRKMQAEAAGRVAPEAAVAPTKAEREAEAAAARAAVPADVLKESFDLTPLMTAARKIEEAGYDIKAVEAFVEKTFNDPEIVRLTEEAIQKGVTPEGGKAFAKRIERLYNEADNAGWVRKELLGDSTFDDTGMVIPPFTAMALMTGATPELLISAGLVDAALILSKTPAGKKVISKVADVIPAPVKGVSNSVMRKAQFYGLKAQDAWGKVTLDNNTINRMSQRNLELANWARDTKAALMDVPNRFKRDIRNLQARYADQPNGHQRAFDQVLATRSGYVQGGLGKGDGANGLADIARIYFNNDPALTESMLNAALWRIMDEANAIVARGGDDVVARLNELGFYADPAMGARFRALGEYIKPHWGDFYVQSHNVQKYLKYLEQAAPGIGGKGLKTPFLKQRDPFAAAMAWALKQYHKEGLAKATKQLLAKNPELSFDIDSTMRGLPEEVQALMVGSDTATTIPMEQVVARLFEEGGVETATLEQRVMDALWAERKRTVGLQDMKAQIREVMPMLPEDWQRYFNMLDNVPPAKQDEMLEFYFKNYFYPTVYQAQYRSWAQKLYGQLHENGLIVPSNPETRLAFYKPKVVQLAENKGVIVDRAVADTIERLGDDIVDGTLDESLAKLRRSDKGAYNRAILAIEDTFQWARRSTIGGLLGGFPLPNTRFIFNNNFTAPLIASVTTPGYTGAALKAVPASFLKAGVGMAEASPARWSSAIRKWLADGGMVDPLTGAYRGKEVVFTSPTTGQQWTRETIEAAIRRNNIRSSQVGFEFGDAMLEDARRLARLDKEFQQIGGAKNAVRYLDPAKKNIWNIWAEQADIAFREGVFVAALKEGKTEAEAAEIGRRVLFDYADVSGAERKVLARHILFYTFARQSMVDVANSVLRPGAGRNLGRQIRFAEKQQRAAETWDRQPDYARNRLWNVLGKDFEGTHTVQAGLQAPPLQAFNALTNALYYLNPFHRDAWEWPEATRAVGEMLFNAPWFDTYRDINMMRKGEEAPHGKVPTSIVISAQAFGAWDTMVPLFDIEPVPFEKRTPGEPTFEGQQYRFGSSKGAARFKAARMAMYISGLQRNLQDWGGEYARMNGIEGAELKRHSDGTWWLHAAALQTPIKAPSYLQMQDKATRAIMKEWQAETKE